MVWERKIKDIRNDIDRLEKFYKIMVPISQKEEINILRNTPHCNNGTYENGEGLSCSSHGKDKRIKLRKKTDCKGRKKKSELTTVGLGVFFQ